MQRVAHAQSPKVPKTSRQVADRYIGKKNSRESERNRSEGHVNPRSCLGLDLIEGRLCTIP